MNSKGLLKVNNSYEGEMLETKIERVTTLKEPITDGAPLIYTERKDGVRPEFDIRTDRFEIAIDAMDAVSRAQIAKRTVVPKIETKDVKPDLGVEGSEGVA